MYESGSLCRQWPDYQEAQPDWQGGFSVFIFWGKKLNSHFCIPVHLRQPDPLAAIKELLS